MPTSNSEAFELLHEGVRRWIHGKGWDGLRDIQAEAIPLLIDGKRDVIVSAGTAGGKTEAAFLPIASALASAAERPGCGFQAVYISPMRALINDQYGRLKDLCDGLDVPVHRWHGDVPQSAKDAARKRPSGILMTTPESVEAILCRRGPEARRLFRALDYVVIDEMHAFMGQPRGKQLQSILVRLDEVSGRRSARVALSATLADLAGAADFLRPGGGEAVVALEGEPGGRNVLLQVRGYLEPSTADADGDGSAEREAAKHIFQTLRGSRGLVFAGSRRRVETLTSEFGRLTESNGVPEEFFAHHGSLSREHREEAERRLKDQSRPASIVCTTTLELGIDVGPIESVAQWGPGHTVSGMRQRLGRSGRREGSPSVLRVYVAESALSRASHPIDALRSTTVQSVAMLNLMLARWNEPVWPHGLHLSTLLHQVLALITERGGATAGETFKRLCGSGAFANIAPELFMRLLRRMGDPAVALIEQAPDGTLLLGSLGERLSASREFYAVFLTPEEYRVVTDSGRLLGTIPVEIPYACGERLLLGGKSWKVLAVEASRREITVERARGGKPPVFGGDVLPPDAAVVTEMRAIYAGADTPAFLDANARRFIEEARDAYLRLGLERSSIIRHAGEVLLFPWSGGRALTALQISLVSRGIEAGRIGVALSVPSEQESLLAPALAALAEAPPPDAVALARLVPDAVRDKFDRHLDADLLAEGFAAEMFDCGQVPGLAAALLAAGS